MKPFKSFDQMTAEDYTAIGLKCGLEVHQQLLTTRKLFCRCPAGQYGSDYDAEILRHMRPTLSELGEYDGTALMEKKTRKNIHYLVHRDTVCTYDIDDSPPFFPDPYAIDIALELAMQLKLGIVSEIHIARKQYLDGSIPAGFQRTAIIGVTGSMPYLDRRIGITQLSIEEDSCREVSDIGHDRVYLTDRLGMPLIEVVTDPDMRTPQELAEVCQVIRWLCRSTGKVRTGYGAARQDVNVSVEGGTRIEIKGVPQITRIPLLVYNEAMRQCGLLHIRDTLKQRGITKDTLACSTHDVTRALFRTPYGPIRKAVNKGHRVTCVVLNGFAGLLNYPTQEHTIFAKEFSDRVRVIACLTKLPNMVHSDTASEQLTVRDWKGVRKKTQADDKDALILVWGDEADTATACQEIILRATEATIGVPHDTRQAHKDGTTGFERVLPGAARMYPDTDLPPMTIDADRLERIRGQLSTPSWERQDRYRTLNLPLEIIAPLSASRRANLFEKLIDELKVNPLFAAVVLMQRFKCFSRDGLHPESLTDEQIYSVFEAYAQNKLTRRGAIRAFRWYLLATRHHHDEAIDISEVADELSARSYPRDELLAIISQTLEQSRTIQFPDDGAHHRFVIGIVMREAGSVVDSATVLRLIDEAMDRRQDKQEEVA